MIRMPMLYYKMNANATFNIPDFNYKEFSFVKTYETMKYRVDLILSILTASFESQGRLKIHQITFLQSNTVSQEGFFS
jgi:hypothetical protein